MDASKVQIGLLEGKENWSTWKYKVCILLRSVRGGLEVLEGKLQAPKPLEENATQEEKSNYDKNFMEFNQADSSVLLLLTVNMNQETLEKVMRFSTARDVWLELHRLFDGNVEKKTYDVCMQFFSYVKQAEDDIAMHTSKLRNLWDSLQKEISKDKIANGRTCNCELPEILLICKILETLPVEYFSFKSSWSLMSDKDKNVDNLTSQLCAYEKALTMKSESRQEVLHTTAYKRNNFICNYCKLKGHKVRDCSKWKADGKPSKPEKHKKNNGVKTKNVSLLTVSSDVLFCENDNDNWYVNNGATNHITNQSEFFENFEPFDQNHHVRTANGDTVPAIGYGKIRVQSLVNGAKFEFSLSQVWYVPSIRKNLFSTLSAHDKYPDSEFVSKAEECHFELSGEKLIVGSRSLSGGLYKLNMKALRAKTPNEINFIDKGNVLQLYHERFGHQNKRHVRTVLKRELGIEVNLDSEVCEGCVYGKAHVLKFGTRERASSPGLLIHSDVCGPFESKSKSGYRYYVLFKDDYCRYRFVYFIRHKSEVVDKMKNVIAEIKAAGYGIREILSDNGSEFDNEQVRKILSHHGIRQRLIMPYTPQQNGCAERENRTVVETARALMHAREGLFDQTFWAEMVNTATYILNRTSNSGIDNQSPFEVWNKKKPNLKHLRIIGSICYAHVPKKNRKKMDKKAVKGVLMGYDNDDGYRIWSFEKRRFFRSRDVIFDECESLQVVNEKIEENFSSFQQENVLEFIQNKDSLKNYALEDRSEEEIIEDIHENPDEMRNTQGDVIEARQNALEDEQETEEINPDGIREDNIEVRSHLRHKRETKLPKHFENYVMAVAAEINVPEEPLSYKEAISCNERENWILAMEKEMKSLQENCTWEMKNLPAGKKAIPCKWVFKLKTNPDGSIDKYKARLVIKGYSQRRGEDYDQTYSPVAKGGTIRSLLSIAAKKNMSLTQFDVCTAFLYGELSEEVYMKQPQGYEDGSNRVCKLRRSLYGLKQAPRCWNQRFTDFIQKLNFKRSDADPCLFIKKDGENMLLLALYVDDGLLASTCDMMKDKFLLSLQKEFKITTKPASYFLGIEIRKEVGLVQINQSAYTKKILERFGMQDCKPVSTPIVKEGIQLGKEDEDELNSTFPYREAVGALMYLMTGTRPDIAFAVSVVSRKLENPSNSDCSKVKRIFRYLKGTVELGISYKAGTTDQLKTYSDADHGGDNTTGRSTTGVLSLYADGAISWYSQRQTSVAISTTEAEIVAASEAAKEIVWLKRLFEEIIDVRSVPTLMLDNEAAIKLSQNPEYHRRTKHIHIRHFFVRELVLDNIIEVKKVSSEYQLADIMTKPLFKPRLQMLKNAMGLTRMIQ